MPDDVLGAIRQKYPVYDQVDDEELARGIAAKYPVYAPHLQQYLSNTSPPQDEPSVSATAKERLAGGMGQEQIGKTGGPSDLDYAKELGGRTLRRVGEAGQSAWEGLSNIGPAVMNAIGGGPGQAPRPDIAVGEAAGRVMNAPMQALRVGTVVPGAAAEQVSEHAGLSPEAAREAGNKAELALQLLTGAKMTAEHAMVQDPETGTMVQKNPLAAPADQKAAAAELSEMKNKPPTPVNPELPVSKTTETAQGPKIEMAPDAGPAEKLHEVQHVLADEGKGPEPAEGAQAKQYAEGTVGAAGNLRPEPISGALGNLSVEEPAGRPGVMPPELSQQTLRASSADPVTAAYVDLVKSGAVEHDPAMPPGIQIVNALKSGKLMPDEYQKIMDAHGVTELDFATNFGLSVSDAGRMLNKMAQVSKALEDAGLKESADVDLPPESWLSYYTRRAGRLLQQSTIVGVIKTARNAMSHYLMSGPISSADTIMQSVLQKIQTEVTGRPPDPQFELHMADGFANMAEVSKSFNGGAKELAQKALESMPSQNQRLYGQMLGDLNDTIGGRAKRGGPLDAGFDAADKVLGIANWGLHWNTMHIRSGSFVANADVLLRNHGMGDLESFSKRLEAGDLTPDEQATWQNIAGQSVTAALKRSFGYAPRASEVAARTGEKVSATEDAAASLVDGINTLPYGKFIPGGMFPRFVYNVVGTYVKQSPLGLLQFVNPAARARFAAGDMSVMTSVITGATLGLAMAGVDQKYGTGKPLEYKFGKDTYTLEPYHPLSFWALYGYAINKAAGGHPDDRGLGTATLGLIAGPEGRAGPGKELANLSDAATQFQAGQQKAALARLAGQRLAGYFTPLNELLNEPQGAELKGTGETVKETKSSNVQKAFLGPIQEKIPYLRESLPDQPRATTTDLSRQGVLGAEGTKNAAEQEFARIGLKPSDIFHGTGIPEVDDAIKAKMGPLVEGGEGGGLSAFVRSNGYNLKENDKTHVLEPRPDAEKPYILEKRLQLIRQTAAKQAAADNPQLFQNKRLMKIPAFKAMFLGSQDEEMKQRLTEAQAEIANQ